MKVLFAESDFWTTDHLSLQRDIQGLLEESYTACKRLLPYLSDQLTFLVQMNANETIAETGGNGFARNFELVLVFIDPALPYGKDKLLAYLKAMAFHELNHAARYNVTEWHTSFLDNCIMEGLATAFERDQVAKPLWAEYEPDVAEKWLHEVRLLGDNVPWDDYMFSHPDGRRWIGYRVGTYLIDQAVQKSGKTVVELTELEPEEIFKLADC